MNSPDPQSQEAQRILRDLSRERGGLFDTAVRRPGDEPPADRVELWARHIGRALGLVFLVLLAVNLVTGWFF